MQFLSNCCGYHLEQEYEITSHSWPGEYRWGKDVEVAISQGQGHLGMCSSCVKGMALPVSRGASGRKMIRQQVDDIITEVFL